jgi:hypothetical protein
MTSGRPRLLRKRLHPYVARELRDRLAQYCAAGDVTESAVVEAALRQYLDRTSDATLLLRRLDRLGRAVARLQRDLALQSEAFAVFVQVWFAHTPAMAADSRTPAQAAAEQRYEKFVDYVAEQFSGGHRFLDDLSRETLADEGELAAAARQDPCPADDEG